MKENNRKKASLRYLRDKSSHEKSELVEQYTFLKVLLNENSANIRHFHDCKNLRGVVYMVIKDFNFFSKRFILSWKRFMQWYFKLAMDFENDNLWFTIKIGSCQIERLTEITRFSKSCIFVFSVSARQNSESRAQSLF